MLRATQTDPQLLLPRVRQPLLAPQPPLELRLALPLGPPQQKRLV